MKKETSRTKDLRPTRKGWTMAMEPATTAAMKEAAPMSSPTAREPELIFMAAKVEKTSGEPLPKARKVTPAYKDGCEHWSYAIRVRGGVTIDSDMPRMLAIVERLMQKKSLAAIPIVWFRQLELPAGRHRRLTVKSITSHAAMILNGMAGTSGKRQ